MITDDALRAAAKEASLALAEALTQGSKQQPPYVPSKSFTCKMSRLCRRERHPVFYRTLQRVAAVFLALLLTGIGWQRASRSRSTTRMISGPVGIPLPVQTSLSLKLTYITVVRFYR